MSKERIHSRGYLPHYDSERLTQFVTFRLADSLPRTILAELQLKLETGRITEIEYHRCIEQVLDTGVGPAWLQDPRVAAVVAKAVLFLAESHYELIAWVIMPTHVHLLIRVKSGMSLTTAMHSLKSYTAKQANKVLGRAGKFWSPDYFDRYIRDRVHFARTVAYIDANPVKAGLAPSPELWPWGSAGCKPDLID